MEEMDFAQYDQYLTNIQDVSSQTVRIPAEYMLQRDVSYYYADINGKKKLAFTLTKGTVVNWFSWVSEEEHAANTFSYGTLSYPTYEKGWRYVRPFIRIEETGMYDKDSLSFYYVKTEELEKVFRDILTMPEMKAERERVGISVNEAVENRIKWIDKVLYEEQYFCSQDLLLPTWRWWDIAIGIVGILIFCVLRGMREKNDT